MNWMTSIRRAGLLGMTGVLMAGVLLAGPAKATAQGGSKRARGAQ